jgi:hypothetical protein
MPEKKSSQSINISNFQGSHLQIGGQAGQDLNVTQVQIDGQVDVIKLIDRVEEIFRDSELSSERKIKIIQCLETVKKRIIKKTVQSINISNFQGSHFQISNLDLTQDREFLEQYKSKKILTQADIIKLIDRVKEIVRGSELSPKRKIKIIQDLETAKEE